MKNVILGALECLGVMLRNIFNGISDENRCITSAEYKSGRITPILAIKRQKKF